MESNSEQFEYDCKYYDTDSYGYSSGNEHVFNGKYRNRSNGTYSPVMVR